MPDLKGYTADQILNMYNKISLDIYLEMGIVDKKTYESVKDDDRKRQELLSNIKTPEGKEANVFAEKFVRKAIDIDNQENTNGVYFENLGTSLLAKAYNELKRILKDEDNKLSAEDREYYERTQNKVTERIDTLIHDLANQVGYHLVFQETIADCYSGYLEMFEARAADLKPNDKLHKEIEKGKKTILDPMITEYDKNVGISNLGASAKDAKTIEKNYDKALKVAYDWKPDEKTLKDVSQYHFLDENGQAQAQFRDDAGNEHTTYEKGDEVIPDRELSEVMNLARSNFAIQNSCDETIDGKTEAQINKELNQELLSTLYECDKASKGAEIS
ncbi:MAG: hypothetical protein IJQ55_03140 [Alphaproteobacteria bacterium]|nr:hypothetical protein [Alphaproteobacteria bacterium]